MVSIFADEGLLATGDSRWTDGELPAYPPTSTALPAPGTRSARPAGEGHVRDTARCGGGLDLVVRLEALQPLPQAHAPAEQDRHHREVHVVDEPGREELADHGGPATDPDVQ